MASPAKNLKRELSHHYSLLIEVMSFPFSEAGQTIHDSKLQNCNCQALVKGKIWTGATITSLGPPPQP